MNRTWNTKGVILSYNSLEPEVKDWSEGFMKSSGAKVLQLFFVVYSHGGTLIPVTQFPANSGCCICFPQCSIEEWERGTPYLLYFISLPFFFFF